MQTPNVYYRDAIESDISFIFSSWLKSYRGSRAVAGIDSSIYYSEQHKVFERILKSCQVTVAVNPADKSQIYGYVIFEEIDGITVYHYLYIKHTFRKMGLMRKLLNLAKKDLSIASMYTHATPAGDKLAAKYNLVYSPYLALTPEYRCKHEDHKKPKETEVEKSEKPSDQE